MTVSELLNAAQGLPFRPPREALEDRPFIVVAPHPDDESLGCGGLIADACRQGLRGKVVIVSDGAGSHPNSKAYPPERLIPLREEEAKQAGAELGLNPEDILFLRLPDRFVSHQGEAAERAIGSIVNCVREIGAGSLLLAGGTIRTTTMGRLIRSRVRFRVGSAGSGCSSMSSGDIRFHPRLRLVRFVSGFRIRIDEETLERKRRAIAAHRSQTTDLIDDDPAGFLFTQIDRAYFDRPYEFFLESDG